jgi:hypothetical protein
MSSGVNAVSTSPAGDNAVSTGETVEGNAAGAKPTAAQMRYLREGLKQPGGKLPLFDAHGQEVSVRTIRSCIERGWAEPWFANPVKPDWLVCKLTETGRKAAGAE